MANDTNIPKLPEIGTRLEGSLRSTGLYWPPLKMELEDSLKSLAWDNGHRNSTNLHNLEIKFSSETTDGKTKFIMNFTGYANKPGPFKSIATDMTKYAKENNLTPANGYDFTQSDAFRTIVEGPDFKKLVNILLEGFLNKQGEKYHVDYDNIMGIPKAQVGDVRNDGQGVDGGRGPDGGRQPG